jgi:IS5 family transposase
MPTPGYSGAHKRPEAQCKANWHIAMRASERKALDKGHKIQSRIEFAERIKANIRAEVEHPFRVTRRQFGYTKVRYRGQARNTAQVTTLIALNNFWMVRRKFRAGLA